MLQGLLLVVLILVCVALTGVILLQRSEGGALGMGGGPSGFMSARGAGDLLSRTTGILAAIFFSLCLALTMLSGHLHGGGSVVDRLKVDALNPDALMPRKAVAPVPAPAASGAPATLPGLPGVGAAPVAAPPAPAAPAPSLLDAPRPQVHVAPASPAPAPVGASARTAQSRPVPSSAKRTAPPTSTNTAATAPSAHEFGVQTAPQVEPTTLAKRPRRATAPAPAAAARTEPAPVKPSAPPQASPSVSTPAPAPAPATTPPANDAPVTTGPGARGSDSTPPQ